jgi:hypothetical protein
MVLFESYSNYSKKYNFKLKLSREVEMTISPNLLQDLESELLIGACRLLAK